MLIDEVKIKIKAGHGGAGAVAFSKIRSTQGPTGGNGGVGGNVYFEGVSDLSALANFRFRKEFTAENGKPGQGKMKDGGAGADIVLKVPVGTIVHNLDTKEGDEIVEVGQKVLVAKGGKGGRGNFLFRSSRKTTPTYAQSGLPGEEFNIFLELKLIATVGLIGLPNVGKSSLLNEITPKVLAKVANYKFTTLEPNLGAYFLPGADYEKDRPLILADIPGLIEGASVGKGLGHKFLRHIQRTKVLFHCISCDSADLVNDYKVIRAELENYDKELIKKQEYILLTKSDLAEKKEIEALVKKMKKLSKKVLVVSIHDEESIEKLKKELNSLG